jgi:hypothetical protein
LRAGHRPPLKLYVQFSRMKCARTHFMRYVASRFMWRPAGNPFTVMICPFGAMT